MCSRQVTQPAHRTLHDAESLGVKRQMFTFGPSRIGKHCHLFSCVGLSSLHRSKAHPVVSGAVQLVQRLCFPCAWVSLCRISTMCAIMKHSTRAAAALTAIQAAVRSHTQIKYNLNRIDKKNIKCPLAWISHKFLASVKTLGLDAT